MSESARPRPRPRRSPGTAAESAPPPAPSDHVARSSHAPTERTHTLWVGWILFAGVILLLTGVFNVINGLVALFRDSQYVVGRDGLLVFDITSWGLVHIILGGLLIIAGLGLFTGTLWARIAAVVLASINAIAQMTFLPAYPAWSLLVIALDVLVIWAVVVHGRELAEPW